MKNLNDNYFSVNIGNLEFEIQHISIARSYDETHEFHWHIYYEIHCVTEGKREIYIDGLKHIVEINDIYIISPSLVHSQKDDDNTFKESILSFSIKENKNSFDKSETNDIKELFSNKNFTKYPDKYDIEKEFYMIEKEVKDRKIGYYTQCKNRIINIIINMARTIDNSKRDNYILPVKNDDKMRIHKLEQLLFIKENQNKSLVQLAEEMSISSRHLSRLIYQQYKMTHSQLINKIKIEEAKILLKTTEYTLDKIRDILNFSSVTYFNKVFKKITGHTTKFYKQKNTK